MGDIFLAGFVYYECCTNMETYRSGHNEPHSKCGYPSGYVGSNPTVSANCEYNIRRHTVLYSVNDIIRYSEIAPDEKLSVFGLVIIFRTAPIASHNRLELELMSLLRPDADGFCHIGR